jgi:hypothetical protein
LHGSLGRAVGAIEEQEALVQRELVRSRLRVVEGGKS